MNGTLFFRVSATRYNVEEEEEGDEMEGQEEEEMEGSLDELLTECKIKLTFASAE